MEKKKSSIRFLIKRYMLENFIESFTDLSKRTGIKYDTLNDHIKNPEKLRKSEIRLLDGVLHFTDEDLITIIRS